MAKMIWRTGKVAFTVMFLVIVIGLCIYGWKSVRTAHAQEQVLPVAKQLIAALPAQVEVSNLPQPTKQEIISSRDRNTRVWEITKSQMVVDPLTHQTHIVEGKSYIREKGCGICYKDQQNRWQVAETKWERTSDGFVINKANYVLTIGVMSGSVLMYDIDGKRFQFRPVSIDAGADQDDIAIAQLDPDIQGQIDSNDPSRLIYRNAFGDGVDLEYMAQPDG